MEKSYIKIILTLLLLSLCFTACEQKQEKTAGPKYLDIRLIVPTEVSSLLTKLSKQFHQSTPQLTDGRLVRVKLSTYGTLPGARKIADGTLKSELWLASSTPLIHWVNTHLENLGPRQSDCEQVFASPVVLAATKNAAPALNAKDDMFSWHTFFSERLPRIRSYTSESKLISFTHENPHTSSGGITSALQLLFLSSVSPSLTTPSSSDLLSQKTLTRAKELEQLVSSYPHNSEHIVAQIAGAPKGQLQLGLVTERAVALYNQAHPNTSSSVHAYYPEEGSFWQNYSLCLSDADWSTTAHRTAAKQFIDFVRSANAQQIAKSAGFRPSGEQGELTAPLLPKFGVNTTLPKRSFQSTSGELLSHILNQWDSLRKPLSQIFLLDTSGSMDTESLVASQRVLRNLVASQKNGDTGAFIVFDTEPHPRLGFTNDKEKLIQEIDSVSSKGGSAIYDALKEALNLFEEEYKSHHNNTRRRIVLITDGLDKNSRYLKGSIVRAFDHAQTKYPIELITFSLKNLNSNFQELQEVITTANGRFYAVRASELEEVAQENI